ncbi:MAG: ArnT family glycosyltransferase [Burkholderiales bacterium]
MIPRLALPPSPAVLVLLALAFVLPGLAGHDLWKTFDAVTLEIAHQMAVTGDWVVPRVAGMPVLDDAPLYHWIALVCGKALGWAIPFHSAARLASGLCVGASLWLLYRTAGAVAPLLLIGAVGLMVHAHEAVPEIAALAAACAAFAVLPRAHQRPLLHGAGFGAALGLAFLALGPMLPGAILAAVLIAHLACPRWRTRRALPFLACTVLVALPLSASWPLALEHRAPQLLTQWWALAIETHGNPLDNLRYFLSTGSWFAWPAWPLAAWALWSRRREWREPRLFVPAASVVLLLAGLAVLGPPQDVGAINLLPPLALLGAEGVQLLRRGAAAALDWFAVMCFTFFALVVWVGYVAMMLGVPARLAQAFARPAPGFEARFALAQFLLALALLVGWLYVAFFTAPSAVRGVTRWAAGLTLLWGTVTALWMPWVDHQKSYRTVALQLRSILPPDAGCIAELNVGLPQRAALSYHGDVRLEPAERAGAGAGGCRLLLVQGHPGNELDAPDTRWVKLADLGRPGDRHERLRLYRLEPR